MSTIIIATTKGRTLTLEKTLRSIADVDVNVIVAVDGHAPDTMAFLTSNQDLFDEVVAVENVSGKYRNPAAAFNEAAKKVKGDKIVFLHDDIMFKDATAITRLLEECKPGQMSRGKVQAYDGKNDEPYENFRQDESTIGGHFFAVTAADFKKLGGFHERITTMLTGELELLVAVGAIEGVLCKYVDNALGFHLRHSVAQNRDFARRHNQQVILQVTDELNEAKVRSFQSGRGKTTDPQSPGPGPAVPVGK